MKKDKLSLKNLMLEAVRVTEVSAMAASKWTGLGDEKKADQAAVDAMRTALNKLDIDGEVVIGEGERDEAPMLYIGEKIGNKNGPKVDVALDPLEGTTICAKGSNNAMTVLAMAGEGNFLNAPDVYMDKISVGPDLPKNLVDLDETPKTNLYNLAKAKKMNVDELVICILDRPRHEELIIKCREVGARIHLISDGDVSGVIATATPDSNIDIYMGSGGSPEGVLAASALRGVGGYMQGRLLFRNDEEKNRARLLGINDFSKKYELNDLACGEVIFSATGVTDGSMLKGIKAYKNKISTESVVMWSETSNVRTIKSIHNL